MEKIKLLVPASSANIGPGFDSVGLALTLYDTLTFEKNSDGLFITGCDEKYQNESNLAFIGYKRTLERLGVSDFSVKITIESAIPSSRGLGSSAALIAGGIFAANCLYDGGLTKAEMLEIGTEIEGHPDNLAAVFYGGLTVSAKTGDKVLTAQFPISENFHFTALIPDFHLSTEKARQVLPKEISRADAVWNISRTALVLKAFSTGDERLLAAALSDRIHEPYRSRLIKGYDTAKRLCDHLGCVAFFISGAGPTLMAVSTEADFSEKFREELQYTDIPSWRVLPLKAEHEGIKII